MPSTAFAYDSAHTTMSCCRWTQPFGPPVLPDEYSQNAIASLCVGSASSAGDASANIASKWIVPGRDVAFEDPTTMTCSSRGSRRAIDRLELTQATLR